MTGCESETDSGFAFGAKNLLKISSRYEGSGSEREVEESGRRGGGAAAAAAAQIGAKFTDASKTRCQAMSNSDGDGDSDSDVSPSAQLSCAQNL